MILSPGLPHDPRTFHKYFQLPEMPVASIRYQRVTLTLNPHLSRYAIASHPGPWRQAHY